VAKGAIRCFEALCGILGVFSGFFPILGGYFFFVVAGVLWEGKISFFPFFRGFPFPAKDLGGGGGGGGAKKRVFFSWGPWL
jgi:hypothetical protein